VFYRRGPGGDLVGSGWLLERDAIELEEPDHLRLGGDMTTRKLVVAVAAVLLLGTTPLIGNAVASTASNTKVVRIEGHDSFSANGFLLNTYHFQPGVITVHQGQEVQFVNKTTDGHTMTLVAKADLPRTIPEVFQCKLCKAVNGVYFAGGGRNPSGVQIDNGQLTDDKDADADTPDPAVPPGAPFTALVEDFDTVAHSNAHAAATIGDSSLIGPVNSPAPSTRTIVVTAPPGTVLHYYCTFHPWMQATIVVVK
jgi:plastocyanin